MRTKTRDRRKQRTDLAIAEGLLIGKSGEQIQRADRRQQFRGLRKKFTVQSREVPCPLQGSNHEGGMHL
jgi:hypothetical protein